MRLQVALALVFLSTVVGCISVHRSVKPGEVPEWINRLPQTKGKLYAVGISGPTYFIEDGKMNAAENARKELAKALSVRVQALSLTLQQNKDKRENEISSVTVSSWATDVVVLHSQILELWIDEEAKVPNSQPGTVYALAVIDFKMAQDAVEGHLQSETQKK